MLKYLRLGNKRVKLIWWILVVVTVITFVGGFIFLFGSGFDSGNRAQAAGALGTINGEPITRVEYQNAVTEQRGLYQQRFKADPGEQESRMLEAQAWRSLVTEHLLGQQAKKLGLKPTDREVVITLQSSPPQSLLGLQDFQTNGQFDPNKYAAALRNPNVNWAPFEQMVREQLPVRKLQERMVTSLKLSQPELEEAYRRRFERIAVSVVTVPAALDSQVAAPGDADLDRVYERYKGRFSAPARVNLEVLTVPKQFGPEEIRVARQQAEDLVRRARQGEDFAQLAKDYSEGPGAQQGGEVNRAFQPAEFGPEMGPRMAAMKKGDISDPIQQPTAFMIVKLLDQLPDPMSPVPSLRIAQIVVKVHAGEEGLRQQFEMMRKVRERARGVGLAKAATEKGLTTTKTSFFPFGNTPPQLFDAPSLGDWAFGARKNDVSPVVEGSEAFFLAQLAESRDAGPAPKTDVMDQLKALAAGEARVKLARPRADQIAQAISQGRTLEQAADAAGLAPVKVASMSREAIDQRLAMSPEAAGGAFATPVGRVLGPVESPGGWIFVRVDAKLPPDSTSFDKIKGQLTSDILQRRQNEFLQAWITDQRRSAKIQDLRTP